MKKMKYYKLKKFFLLGFLLFFLTNFGCNSKNDAFTGAYTDERQSAMLLSNVWKFVDFSAPKNGLEMEMILYSDGTQKTTTAGIEETGTWKLSTDENYLMVVSGTFEIFYEIQHLTEDQLKLQLMNAPSETVFFFTAD
jgi:hypothetical protein